MIPAPNSDVVEYTTEGLLATAHAALRLSLEIERQRTRGLQRPALCREIRLAAGHVERIERQVNEVRQRPIPPSRSVVS